MTLRRLTSVRASQAEIMRDDVYVPNDVMFGSVNNKVMVITGPNMAVSLHLYRSNNVLMMCILRASLLMSVLLP